MNTIAIKHSITTNLDSSFDKPISQIGLKDTKLGSGGFGKVYEVATLNGKPSKLPLVAKLFFQGTERNYQNTIQLQKIVRDKAAVMKKAGKKFFDLYPALIAMPLLSFEGMLDGETVRGHLSLNLNQLGFFSVESGMRTDAWTRLKNRPMYFKYKMSQVLTKGCAFLREIHFIHADITPDNLFIHPTAPLCALIDYDSGAIITSSKDAPTTKGKPYSEWMAPELTCDDPKINKLTAFVDDWAVAVALHNILAGSQVFYTKHCTFKALEKWRKMYDENPKLQWPKISSNKKYAELFNEHNLKYFNTYLDQYGLIDDAVKKGFETTFVIGALNFLRRWDSNKWTATLDKCIANCKSKMSKEAAAYFEKTERSVRAKFPDEQSTANIHSFNTQWETYVKIWCDVLLKNQSLIQHKIMVIGYAKQYGQNGEEVYNKLPTWVKKLKECKKLALNDPRVKQLKKEAADMGLSDAFVNEMIKK